MNVPNLRPVKFSLACVCGVFDLIVEYFLEHLDLLRTQAKAK